MPKISEYSQLTSASPTDIIVINDMGEIPSTKKISLSNLIPSCVGYTLVTDTLGFNNTSGSVCKVTINNAIPGTYFVYFKTYMKTMISGTTNIQYSYNDSEYSNIYGDSAISTHDYSMGRQRVGFGYANISASGIIYFRAYHETEGYFTEYNDFGDQRFGTIMVVGRMGFSS